MLRIEATKLVLSDAKGSSPRSDQRRREPVSHHQRQRDEQYDEHHDERADTERADHLHGIAAPQRRQAADADRRRSHRGCDQEREHPAGEVQQADERERPELRAERGKQMGDGKLPATVKRAASEEHAAGEHRGQYHSGDLADERDKVQAERQRDIEERDDDPDHG